MRNQLTIYLPVETKSRELPYKSPLAFILADLGCKVIIGRQQEVRLSWYKSNNFFYVDKSAAKTKLKLFQDIKKCNGNIGVFCEEGLLYKSKEQYLSERIYEKSLEFIDIFWCWGTKQYNDINEKFKDTKIKIINPPRLAPSYKYRKNKINIRSDSSRKIILFLTSFGIISKKLKSTHKSYLNILKKRGTFNPALGEKFYNDWEDYSNKYKKYFLEMINKLCIAFPKDQLKIKIHPTEIKSDYENVIKKNDNLDFSDSNSLEKSIISSTDIISSYSTSAIEARLICDNSLVYSPISDNRYEPKIIKDLCKCYKSVDAIINNINNKNKKYFPKKNFSYYVESSEKDEFQILLNYAKEIIIQSNYSEKKLSNKSILIRFKYFLKSKIRYLIYFLKFKKESKNIIDKCKYISGKDIINYSEEFFSGNLAFSNIKLKYNIEKLSNNVFEISKL